MKSLTAAFQRLFLFLVHRLTELKNIFKYAMEKIMEMSYCAT